MSKKIINGDVNLSNLHLKQLPSGLLNDVHVSGYFYCYDNKLISLKGSPKTVGGNFDCSYNKLTSLEGAPSSVDGDFLCGNNSVQFTEEQVRAVCNVKGRVYV